MLQLRSTAFCAGDQAQAAEGQAFRLLNWNALAPGDEGAWHALGHATEAPSVFAEPWLMRRSLAHCDPGQQAQLAVVEGDDGEWLGVLPVMSTRRQGRSPVPAWKAWTHPNQFTGSPLVRRGQAERFWRGLLDGLARHGSDRVALALSQLPTDDPATRALLFLCEREGRLVAIDNRSQRACLNADPGVEPPDQGAKQRSRIRGLERKLEAEVGAVDFAVVRDPERNAAALNDFLALERSGWKGHAGSALACADATRSFFLDAARAAAMKGRLEVATLTAAGRIIAMSTQLVGEGRTYGFKAAYDEDFASCAPGLLLLDRLTRFYFEQGTGEIDSCAVPGQQPVSRLWHARRELIDCRVALGGRLRAGVFSGLLAAERVARGIRKA